MEVEKFMQDNAISSTVVEFMQNNAISIATGVGAVAIVCFILAKSYDKIVVKHKGDETTMTLLKNQNSVEKNVVENVANFRKEFKKKLKGHKEEYNDKINLKNDTNFKNVANVDIINNEEVEGGETKLSRVIG